MFFLCISIYPQVSDEESENDLIVAQLINNFLDIQQLTKDQNIDEFVETYVADSLLFYVTEDGVSTIFHDYTKGSPKLADYLTRLFDCTRIGSILIYPDSSITLIFVSGAKIEIAHQTFQFKEIKLADRYNYRKYQEKWMEYGSIDTGGGVAMQLRLVDNRIVISVIEMVNT